MQLKFKNRSIYPTLKTIYRHRVTSNAIICPIIKALSLHKSEFMGCFLNSMPKTTSGAKSIFVPSYSVSKHESKKESIFASSLRLMQPNAF